MLCSDSHLVSLLNAVPSRYIVYPQLSMRSYFLFRQQVIYPACNFNCNCNSRTQYASQNRCIVSQPLQPDQVGCYPPRQCVTFPTMGFEETRETSPTAWRCLPYFLKAHLREVLLKTWAITRPGRVPSHTATKPASPLAITASSGILFATVTNLRKSVLGMHPSE